MLVKWYRFDVDRLAARGAKLLVSRDGRNQLISGLTPELGARISLAFQVRGHILADELPMGVERLLVREQIIVLTPLGAPPPDLPTTRSWFLKKIFELFHQLGSFSALICSVVISIIIAILFGVRLEGLNVIGLLESAPLEDVGLAILVATLTVMMHEMGHLMASYHYTGVIGQLRFRLIWGVPAVTVDVSSFCLASRLGKFCISIAGCVFQVFVSVVILATCRSTGVRAGAASGLILAAFNLLPLPRYDGYWILVDLFGREFVPQIAKTADRLNICYGLVLLSISLLMLPYPAALIFEALLAAVALFDADCLRAFLLLGVGLVSATSLAVFFKSLLCSLAGRVVSPQ